MKREAKEKENTDDKTKNVSIVITKHNAYKTVYDKLWESDIQELAYKGKQY